MSIKKQVFDCIYEKHNGRVSIKKQVFDCIYEKHDGGCLLRSRFLTVYRRNTTTGVY